MDIQKKATCPICLQLFSEPVSLGCGHSVCQACISVKDKNSVISPREGESNCPVCGTRYSTESQYSADMVKKLQKVELNSDIEKRDLCVQHGEKRLLFCAEDREVICWLCERSQEHRGHHTFLLEERVKECQEKLQAALRRLRKEQQEAEKVEADLKEKRISWKHQIQNERLRIWSEFSWMRITLDYEEKRELQRLKEEETKILESLAEAEAALAQQTQVVQELISDLERRTRWSTEELLQDMSGIMKWCEIWTLKKPEVVPLTLKSVSCTTDLIGILQSHRELKDVRGYWADFTLNPDHLNMDLVLSEDQRQVTCEPIWPAKFCNYGILGSKYFSSGKHYWEVDVSKKTAWILGVYCRKQPVKMAVREKHHPNVYSTYKPQHGYWVIGLQKGSEYKAFDNSFPCHGIALSLITETPPLRVGVFLHYDAGIVSFFNVTNHGSLIYRFMRCCFSEPAYPYFNPWVCSAPMTLCPPPPDCSRDHPFPVVPLSLRSPASKRT